MGLLVTFGLTACYNKEFNEPGKLEVDSKATEKSIPVGYDKTWAAVQSILSRFPINRRDSDDVSSRAFIVTDWVQGKSDILYHGFDDNRISYSIRYRLTVYVIGGAMGTKIQIKNIEQYRDDVVTAGTDIDGSLFAWIRTESSTLKEARLLDEIEKLARDPKFQP